MHELGATQGITDRAARWRSPTASHKIAGLEMGTPPPACLSCSDAFSTGAPHPICPQCGSLLVQLDLEAPMVRLTDIDIDHGADRPD